MHDLGMLDDVDYDDAMSQSLWWSGFGPPPKPSVVLYPAPKNEFQRYPYFLSYVREYLEKKYGDELLYQGGLDVYLSIDPRLQAAAEASVAHEMRNSAPPLEMSLVSLDPATGMIKALVGGRDFYGDYKGAQVNLAVSKFPPGSSFKAFTAAASLESGRPASIRLYAPETITKPGCRTGCVIKNSSPGESGNWDMATAMGMSINTWFVNLIDEIGFQRVVDLVHRLGVNPTPGPDGFNHQLTLGKNETSPLEMASGYSVFANRGVKADPTPVAKVVRPDGVVLEDNTPPHGTPVMNPIVADWMSQVLRTPIEKGTATGSVKLDRMAAGKTGTVDGHTNAWFVGYVPQLATAVWIGHSDEFRTIYLPGEGEVFGAGPPARAWNAFMNQALVDVPVVNFNPPEPLPPPEQLAVPLPGEQLVKEEVHRPPARTPGVRSIPEDCGGPCVVNPVVQAPQAAAPVPRTTPRPASTAPATAAPPTTAAATTAPSGGGSP
jgi:penicillin-binding protein 1A